MIRRHAVLALLAAVCLDRAITVSAFHHEANPLVTALGPFSWLAVSLALLGLALPTWYHWQLYESRIAVFAVTACTGLTLLAVLSNAYVLL